MPTQSSTKPSATTGRSLPEAITHSLSGLFSDSTPGWAVPSERLGKSKLRAGWTSG